MSAAEHQPSAQWREFPSLEAFCKQKRGAMGKGPIALIVMEDDVEAESSLAHLHQLGFRHICAFLPEKAAAPALPASTTCKWTLVRAPTRRHETLVRAMNALISIAQGEWLHYCYNAEYLFFPFCEDRSVGELATFVTEERRDSVLTYVIDLYAGDLSAHRNAVDLDTALLDSAGYFAEARQDEDGNRLERQHDFYGGLRWRFEEHIPKTSRRIDRISLFRAKAGLRFLPDHRLSDPEMNTYACQWHHSVTAAVCSFRVAKALRHNAGSRYDIADFRWHRSTRFQWSGQQLMDLGLMEPGQWF